MEGSINTQTPNIKKFFGTKKGLKKEALYPYFYFTVPPDDI